MTYTVNNLNQYTNVNGTALSYDNAGLLQSDGRREFSYNPFGQLTEVYDTQAGNSVFYSYDGFGRRLQRRAPEGTERYIYAGGHIVAAVAGDGTRLREYLYHPDYIDSPILLRVFNADGSAFASYWYQRDGQGNVVALTDEAGHVVERCYYDAFGVPVITDADGTPVPSGVSAFGNDLLFKSRPFDYATGLYDFRARTYSPDLGRFLQSDPLGFVDGGNLYAFVHNDPVNLNDPSGKAIPALVAGGVLLYVLFMESDVDVNVPPEVAMTSAAVLSGGASLSLLSSAAPAAASGSLGAAFLAGSGGFGAAVSGTAAVPIAVSMFANGRDRERALYAGSSLLAFAAPPALLGGVGGGIIGGDADSVMLGAAVGGLAEVGVAGGVFGLRGLRALGRRLAPPRVGASSVPGPGALAPRAGGIKTPWGSAVQGTSKAATAARPQVEGGGRLYRIGTTGKSNAAGAQFWSLEHPLSPGFASRYGIPAGNVANANFIQSAVLKPGSNFVTRSAPGIGNNVGGGIEVVVPEGGAILQSFNVIR